MKQEDYDFFRDHGYLSLGKILSDEEISRFGDSFERDRRDFARFWKDNGIWQTQNCDALLTAPEFDGIVRHPRVLGPLGDLMGGEVSFSEICLRHMGPYAGEPIPGMTSWDGGVGRRWHRDGGDRFIWPEHPLRIGYVQLMVYLTDVSEATHSFAVSPEPVGEEILDKEAQLRALRGPRPARLRRHRHPLQRVPPAHGHRAPDPVGAQIGADLLRPPPALLPQRPVLHSSGVVARPCRRGGPRILRSTQR